MEFLRSTMAEMLPEGVLKVLHVLQVGVLVKPHFVVRETGMAFMPPVTSLGMRIFTGIPSSMTSRRTFHQQSPSRVAGHK
ncbi:MAG: hypothetical protein WCO97_07995 [bacterium]